MHYGKDSQRAAIDPKVYDLAVQLIERRGWIKDELCVDKYGKPIEREEAYDQGHSFCVMGALEASAYHYGYDAHWCQMITPATQVMELPRFANWWNNLKTTTKEDVIEALQHGAERLRGDVR